MVVISLNITFGFDLPIEIRSGTRLSGSLKMDMPLASKLICRNAYCCCAAKSSFYLLQLAGCLLKLAGCLTTRPIRHLAPRSIIPQPKRVNLYHQIARPRLIATMSSYRVLLLAKMLLLFLR